MKGTKKTKQTTAFQLGDYASWTSQSQGSATKKTAMVVEVVPPNKFPTIKIKKGKHAGAVWYSADGRGGRNHESYVLETEDGVYYWPVASLLKPAKAPNPTKVKAAPPARSAKIVKRNSAKTEQPAESDQDGDAHDPDDDEYSLGNALEDEDEDDIEDNA